MGKDLKAIKFRLSRIEEAQSKVMEEKNNHLTTDDFKKQLTQLLHQYNEDQGHVVTGLNIDAIRENSHIKKALYYNLEIIVE